MLILIYIGGYKPFNCREKNYIEIFNEIFICLITGHSLFFTDIVPTRASRFKVGWSMILLMIINAACNLSKVIKLTLKNLYLFGVKVYRIIKRKLDPNFGRNKTK